MSEARRILLVGNGCEDPAEALSAAWPSCGIVVERNPLRAMALLTRERFDGVFVAAQYFRDVFGVGKHLENARILETLPYGVALLESDNTIIWANGRLREFSGRDSLAGASFYAALGNPVILGPDLCPFHMALATGEETSTTLRSEDNRYFQLQAAPLREMDGPAGHLIVTIRDVTHEVEQQQKLAAIHQAGMKLVDLTPEEICEMPIQDRIKLLKSNIIHFTQDLLHFEVAEIRLLDRKTNRLEPLLAVGIDHAAAMRDLFALPQGNGVTGFVAATGKSYLCEDTTADPLFLEGVHGAKSSLTVPLLLHDEVIGTFNVESTELRAFSESDLQFLEIFSRDVAAALNTLELLVAEKANAAAERVEAIQHDAALSIDEILNEAANVMQRYTDHQADVVERLQRILHNAREIRQVIQKFARTVADGQPRSAGLPAADRPLLRDRRVLFVDADGELRSAVHSLLNRCAITVETAHDGTEAACMVRATSTTPYDVIIADIRLPDMTGYELMLKLQEWIAPAPLVLMAGYGYDPGHSIANARKAGLPAWAILYKHKPLRLDPILDAMEFTIRNRQGAS